MSNDFSNSLMALESKTNRNLYSDDKKYKIKPQERQVCKFWIQNMCKKGDLCDFLHEDDKSKYPECSTYEKEGSMIIHFILGICNKSDCPFKHTPRAIKECQFYAKGFCKDGGNVYK